MANVEVQGILDGMTLEQKIAQMFIGSVSGGEDLDQAKQIFQTLQYGGFSYSYIFEYFIRGGNYIPCGISKMIPITETAEFLCDVQKAAIDIIGIPLIITADQEGGMEESLYRREPVVLTPTQMGMGSAGTPQDAYTAGTLTAVQWKAVGMNMFLGPCVDVNSNPKNPEISHRSFSDLPEVVAEMSEQVIKAYQDQGVIATAKHFPGRGNSGTNAHAELDVLDMPREHFDEVEFVPFRRAIEAGVETVMLAHTIYPALGDDKLPASLSPTIVRDVLRGELGFEGVIYTDDITMFAVSNNYGIPTACAMAIEAGCDMILMKVNEKILASIDAIKKSIKAGQISEEQIDNSVRRLLELKVKYGCFEEPKFSKADVLKKVGTPEQVKTGRQLARRAVLAVKNAGDIFPLIPDRFTCPLVIMPRDLGVVAANDPDRSHDMFTNFLRRYFPKTINMVIDQPPTEHQLYEVEGLVKNADVVVLVIPGQVSAEGTSDGANPLIKLLDDLVEWGRPVIVILTSAPYAAARLNEKVRGIACSFSINPLSFEAVVDLICGKIPPHGKLPVHINDSMPRGFSAPIGSG